MKKIFRAQTTWTSLAEADGFDNVKTHRVFIDDKPPLTISADKTFKGDPSKYNPEDLLLTALSSCHMMSYLYVCGQHHIELITYQSEAIGVLELQADGSGAFTSIRLELSITVSKAEMIAQAKALHKAAGKLCFIANSLKVPISYKPQVVVASDTML